MTLAGLSKGQQTLINISAMLICGVLLYIFVLSPEIDRYYDVKAQFNSKQQQNIRAISRLDTLLEEYQELRMKADNANKLLFSRKEADNFLEQLPILSESTGNSLEAIVPKDSQSMLPEDERGDTQDRETLSPLAEIAEMPVGVTIRGGYGEIIDLFGALEGFKQLMAISEMGVTTTKENRNEVDTTFMLNLIHAKANIKATFRTAEILARQNIKPPLGQIPGLSSAAEEKSQTPDPRVTTTSPEAQPKTFEKTIRYAVQVGAFNVEDNSKELAALLETRGYAPWVRPSLITGDAPHHVLVGKFDTKQAAYEFAELMKKELPWVKEYIVKRAMLDLDTVLKETRIEE